MAMPDIARTLVREPSVGSPQEYARRVHRLAVAYVGLFVLPLVGIGLLIWQAHLLVTLTQRSNVETLTLLFLLLFFLYLATLSARGVVGAARIAHYALLVRLGRDRLAVERQKMEALGPPIADSPSAALNKALDAESPRGQPLRLVVEDAAGPMGTLAIDGADLRHRDARRNCSNSLLAFFVEQVNKVLQARGVDAGLDVLHWKKIHDEETEAYLSIVRFARNLERHLGGPELWPRLTLTDADCRELERRLAAVCPALRDEGFLPDWEYSGEHKLPLIPEPLGLISLSRSETRVDPVASMGCAVLIVGVVVGVLALLIVFPPWVPGS
jgi:hypothetical protein